VQGISTKLAYTVEEAAELLSLSRAHVYRLLDVRELGSVTIGRSRRITHSQLLAFVRALENVAAVQPHTVEEMLR
jgi:excisionase family DNA binding protein